MKITESHGTFAPVDPSKPYQGNEVNGEFQKVMDQAVQELKSKQPPPQRPVIGLESKGLGKTNPVGQPSVAEAFSHRDTILSEIHQTLDLVDFYIQKLGDASIPVRDLHSLMDHMERKMQTLKNFGEQTKIPDNLQSILSDLFITLGTEAAKFRRGDYE